MIEDNYVSASERGIRFCGGVVVGYVFGHIMAISVEEFPKNLPLGVAVIIGLASATWGDLFWYGFLKKASRLLKSSRLRKAVTVVAAVFILIMLFNMATYLLWGIESKVLTASMLYPQYTHYDKRAKFEYVVINTYSWHKMSKANQSLLLDMLNKSGYKVYYSERALPSKYRIFEKGVQCHSFGWVMSWEEIDSGAMWFTAEGRDYEAPLSWYHAKILYVWMLFKWIPIYWDYARA